ncbi:MAG: hypothetical protein V3W52_17265 [Syntrophobacteria bacterium]
MKMVRIIQDAPQEMTLVNGVAYDGMIDHFVQMDNTAIAAAQSNPKVKYMASAEPTMEDDGEGNQIQTRPDTELKPAAMGLKKRHTYAGWTAVGEDVPLPEPIQ